LGLLALVAFAPAGAAKSLSEVVQLTVSTHPEIKREMALRRGAENFVDQEFAGYLPTLDLDAGTGFEFTNSPTTRNRITRDPNNDPSGIELWRNDASLRLNQMLFDGFETRGRVRSARAERDAATFRITATGERIGIRAVEVYLGVLRNQAIVALAEDNVAGHEDILERVRQQTEAGITDEIDLEQGLGRLALAQANLSQRRGGLRRATAEYTEVVGEPPQELVRPVQPDYDAPIDVDSAIATALNNNPSIEVTTATLRARRSDIGVARAPYFPRFDLELSGTTIDNRDGRLGPDTGLSAMLRMRYNIFRGFFDRASTRRATFEAAAAAEDDGEARRQVREDVRLAFRALLTAQARLVPLRDRVDASERTLEAYVGQFELGRRSLFDLLDTQNELFQARTALVDGDYDVLLAHFRLLSAMGMLLQVVGIDLGG
jgi:adhesin transport system outer membrane protein